MVSLASTRDYLKKLLRSTKGQEILAFSCFFIIIITILFSNFIGPDLNLKAGDVSRRNIKAPRDMVVTDAKATREAREKARNKVGNKYQDDPTQKNEAADQIARFFSDIQAVRNDSSLTDNEKQAKMEIMLAAIIREKQLTGYDSRDLASYLVDASDRDIISMKNGAAHIVDNIMGQPIKEDTLNLYNEQVRDDAKELSFDPAGRRTVEVASIGAIRARFIFDREATERAKAEAEDNVRPIPILYRANQAIVRDGEVITKEHIDILEQMGMQRSRDTWATLAGTALFVLVFMALALIYLKQYHRVIYIKFKMKVLLGLIFILVICCAKLITSISSGNPDWNTTASYLIPVATGSMLVAILLNQNLAFVFTFVVALFVGLMTEVNQISFALVAFVGGSVGIYRITRLDQNGDLVLSSLYIAGANVVSIITVTLVQTGFSPDLWMGIAFGAGNGIISAVLTIGLLPFLENGFAVTSMVRLLELVNPNQPLLRRLLVEAPGTYHHSIMVGNLAESAANTIGANVLLVRVGAYYHDIGKLKRPYFFVENQIGSENPHEKIAPSLSALIITSHIKDGVELTKQYKIPRLISKFIEQHHGTSLVKYFYSRALEDDKEGNVNEETFRYEGPKPQSREVALVMLADSVEAAVRSMNDPSPGRIEGMVHRIIKDKLYDGQMEECCLTFRDLNLVADAFTKVLNGVYHNRVEYPETFFKEFASKEGES
ncbi:MAG: HD family phosphohydrolase [Acidobacteriota bacterium]